MHIQVVTFHLEGLSGEDYLAACNQLAPAIAQVPGLISKTFIGNPETNTYGGVHVWRDRESMEAYRTSDLWRTIEGQPAFVGLVSQEFGVLEEPSRVTRGLEAVAA
ncbi:MAG: YdhR family protein [Chloroflexota bacterium]